jgi:hypothetical protein
MALKKEMTLSELERLSIELIQLVTENKLKTTIDSRKASNEKRMKQIATRIKCNIPHSWKDTNSTLPLVKNL